MPMKEKIINFRPTPQALAVIEQMKRENKELNVSQYINSVIVASGSVRIADYTELLRFIPEENAELYLSKIKGSGKIAQLHSIPISQLSMRRYAEAMQTVKDNGYEYFHFRINENETFAVIAVSREEAGIEFSRYFIRDESTGYYLRTSVPLPIMRYDVANKTVIIFNYEP